MTHGSPVKGGFPSYMLIKPRIILKLLMLISKELREDQRQKSKEMKGNLAGR